mgnify:CR=1 FL=1
MSKKIVFIFFLFYGLLSYNAIASEADQVNTDSEDFDTTIIEDEIYDPLEPINRAIFSFNNIADKIVLEPVAKGYKSLPSPIQSGVSNFLSNLRTPLVVFNQLLQGQGKNAFESSSRFVVNSTLGIFGLIDVADKICQHFGASLTLLNIISENERKTSSLQKTSEEVIASTKSKSMLKIVKSNNPVETISEESASYDLLILGTPEKDNWLRILFGSGEDKFVKKAACSVLRLTIR